MIGNTTKSRLGPQSVKQKVYLLPERRDEVSAFFKVLEEDIVKHDLTNRHIDEIGIQLINEKEKNCI